MTTSQSIRFAPRAMGTCLGAALLSGCVMAPVDARRDADYHSRASMSDRPVARPARALTSFSDSLGCMDRMLRASNLPTTLIASKQIPDPTGKVPVATKDMIVTSLSQMSRLSNAFRYVDFEVDIARQDTVQNLTTILLNNNQIQLQRPALYVSGAISYYDQNVLSNRLEAGTSASRLDTGYSRNRNATVIGLEMHLGDFRTRTLIPGLDSANEVVIGTAGDGLDLAGRIGSYGVKFNIGRDYTHGSGGAVRTLVDLAVVELVGKWARVPYWQCLTLDQTHPAFQRQMRDWYDEVPVLENNKLVQRSLVSRGYLPETAIGFPADDPVFMEALGRFQADQGLVVTGVVDFSTYERALRGFVTLGPEGQMMKVGWEPRSNLAPPRNVPGTAIPIAPLDAQAQPPMVDMQLENPLVGRPAFEVGEQIFVSAALSRAAYLSCYFQDAVGHVSRVLPNPLNPHALSSGNLTIRIPDWMSPLPAFVMDATAPGTERLACYATGTDVGQALGKLASAPSYQPIAGVDTLEGVNAAMDTAAGKGNYGFALLEWPVVPRRVAPAGNGAQR